MTNQVLTKQDLEEVLNIKLSALKKEITTELGAKIDQVATEQAETLADFVGMVNERFDRIEEWQREHTALHARMWPSPAL